MRARYSVLPTSVDRSSESYRGNDEANREGLDRLESALKLAREGGGEKAEERFRARGKMLPRERIAKLLDRDSFWLELCPLAGHEVSGHATGASVIGGIGLISGTECLITASDATVKGGAISELSFTKTARLSEIAEQNRLPTVNLIESAGADLTSQHKIFVPGGRMFRDLSRRSAARIPSICIVLGSSTAGGAYIPGMSDYVVMVKERSQVYLAGPPLVKMATGEESNHEDLGGADMHSRVSGVSDFLANDENEALGLGRQIVAQLGWKKKGPSPSSEIEAPRYPADELLGLVSSDIRIPYDVREVIARIVDGSRFCEFKRLYGSSLVCGWAHLHGYRVGILGNNGALFSESANKGAHFIELCNQSDTPLLFLQNITGFMVGKKVEQEGIIKAGAKMINAVSNSTVPAITIMTGASYGAGNYAMAGRAYQPRFVFSWPNHRIAVMGGKQLAGVIDIIKREAAARKGATIDDQQLEKQKEFIEAQIDVESDPFFASARLWDDGIIDPRHTRSVIAIALSAAHNAPVTGTMKYGVFRH